MQLKHPPRQLGQALWQMLQMLVVATMGLLCHSPKLLSPQMYVHELSRQLLVKQTMLAENYPLLIVNILFKFEGIFFSHPYLVFFPIPLKLN